ncbi:MAG: threonine/serine dehydratase [Planctomycetota bacterium]|jgi:threonine dehydratase
MIPLSEIRGAAARLAGRIHRTPLLTCRTLGERVGVTLHLKCECLQKTGSFKARGALNKALSLPEQDLERGLITVSAGNHAQAVAWAAAQQGAPCTVVMPDDAPRSKLAAVEGYGARIVLHSERATLFEALAREQERTGAVFVHPFDDPVVLAGAATAGLEIVEQLPEVDVVLVPVGGGGLMAGVASAVKALRPACRVVAVELAAGPGLGPALAAGRPVPVPRPTGTLADGMTPPFVGQIPMDVARACVDSIVEVSEPALADAMAALAASAKLVVEGSGAAATAALLSGVVAFPKGTRVASLVSGGNVDGATYADVLARVPPAG